MKAGWREDGYAEEDVQVWAIGWAGQGGYAPQFAGESDSSCFADTSSGADGVYALFDAYIDDLFLIDRDGQVRYVLHLVDFDLQEKDNRRDLDGWVRKLLDEG